MPNGRMTDEQWIGKDLEGRCRGVTEIISRYLAGDTKKPLESSVRIAGFGRYSERALHEYRHTNLPVQSVHLNVWGMRADSVHSTT
jgi:hypothetical protein